MNCEEWFEKWFDSKYYHLLYQHRDEAEAEGFLKNLIDQLPIPSAGRIIDIGCGNGRHARYLNDRGFEVDGIDLSSRNIKIANHHSNPTLKFHIYDMRNVFKHNHYDGAFNLFTSFGYFENPDENYRSFNAMTKCLKPGGILVVDYLNSNKIENEIAQESLMNCEISNISFRTKKYIDKEFIVKEIKVIDDKKESNFMERVKLIPQSRFIEFAEKSGLQDIKFYGDYSLNKYNQNTSERLILTARKK